MIAKQLFPLLLAVAISVPVSAAGNVLLQSKHSWDGGDFSYPSGDAQVTAITLTLQEGEVTPYHCHPIPTFGYILSGNVEVKTKSGKTTLLTEGSPAVEVMETIHRGKAVGGPVEILVFYAGSDTVPNTVIDDGSAKAKQWCKE